MDTSDLIALALSVLLGVVLVAYRLLWLGSSAAAGLGRIRLSRILRHWLLDEHNSQTR